MGQGGITYEADQRHAEIITKILGLEGKKGLSTPGVRAANEKDEELDDEFLERKEAGIYRAITARGNYLSQDRTDIKYAVKELSRQMAKPRRRDWRKIVRFGKYLLKHGRYVCRFGYQDGVSKLDVWTDTDYAGCRETRKSTSGGVIQLGGHTIRGWSNTQKVIALSSGEAEYYGIVKGISEGIGTRSILQDMDVQLKIRVKEDSSAALGMANRTGLGKVRHIEVNQLWIQEKVRSKEVEVVKVAGVDNLADALTKNLEAEGINKHLKFANCYFAEGRHELMPEVVGKVEEIGFMEGEPGED